MICRGLGCHFHLYKQFWTSVTSSWCCCRLDSGEAMSRCSACNAADFRLIQPREAAAGLVPPRVFEVVEEFWRCAG